MSKKFGLIGLESVENKYLDGRSVLNCSDATAAEIDTEVMKILKDSYKEAKKLLKENRALMDKLAAHLIEKETITGKEFMAIFRKEKGLPEPEEPEKKEEEKDGRTISEKVDTQESEVACKQDNAESVDSVPVEETSEAEVAAPEESEVEDEQ